SRFVEGEVPQDAAPSTNRLAVVGAHYRESRSASPWPPPPHSATAALPDPRRDSSCAAWAASRAPDAPIGCPRAIAPPWMLTRSWETPRSRIDWMATEAKASLISMKSRSLADQPARARAALIALD